jgi:outer membrane protein assembly factor BamB
MFGLASRRLSFLTLLLLLCLDISKSTAEDWPQWRGPGRDGVWDETGIIESFSSSSLQPVWRAPVGSGFSGPTVAEGRVFLTDRVVEPEEQERIHCFDATSGKSLWSYPYACAYQVDYPLGPRASVSIDEGYAYALGTMGHMHCLEVATGKEVWKKDLKNEYQIDLPIWGIAASPLIYQDVVILHIGGVNGACVVALDKKTGTEKWRALDESASYSAPILVGQAGKKVVVCWTGRSLSGLDATDGKVLWAVPFKPSRMVLNVATPVFNKDRILVSAFYDGSLLLRLSQDKPTVEEIWRRSGKNENKTDSLHSIISTPILDGDFIYGVDSYGQFRGLNASNGDRIWENLTVVPNVRWGTIHMVRNRDRYFMFCENGDLIIARLAPSGITEVSRAKLIEPTTEMTQREVPICWSHPAFANRCVYARSDKELICVDLSAK